MGARRRSVSRLEQSVSEDGWADAFAFSLLSSEPYASLLLWEAGKLTLLLQFTSMLDIIETYLMKEGRKFVRCASSRPISLSQSRTPLDLSFRYCRCSDDGSMADVKRQVSLDKIKNDPTVKIILISFKAGSTGAVVFS